MAAKTKKAKQKGSPGAAKGNRKAGSKGSRKVAKSPGGRSAAQIPKAGQKPPGKKGAKASKPAQSAAAAKLERERLLLERERAQAKLARERDQAALAKEREKLKLAEQRERELLAKEREKSKASQVREQKKLAEERERTRREKEQARQKLAEEREKVKLAEQRERERVRSDAKRAAELRRQQDEKQKERERKQAQLKAQQEAKRLEREAERLRIAAEREEERRQRILKREAEKEEARLRKEEERRQREAEREAYRKAKEAERERLRAEKETARRALEGRVARAAKRAQAMGGIGRGATARVYRADSIPNQRGTTRTAAELAAQARHAALAARAAERRQSGVSPALVPPKPQPPAPQVSLTIEERYERILARIARAPSEFQHEYADTLDMSWIYHDSALEGSVYTFQELKTALQPNAPVVPDATMQPVCEEIRRHKIAIDLVRELGEKKRIPITVDTVRKLYLTLHPEEGDLKSVRYRKDIPQHRLYFHEYCAPDKIAQRVRLAVEWLDGPEPKKLKSPVRIASHFHYEILRIFPFPVDSGKVARLLMNILLLRAGHPPAIVHSTERQRYYEALKSSLPTIVMMVSESISNALQSVEKRLDELPPPLPVEIPLAAPVPTE